MRKYAGTLGLLCGLLAGSPALGNPQGGVVMHGNVQVPGLPPNTLPTTNVPHLNITNSPNAIINWQQFGINPGEITRFIQQNADSAVLNRVIGQDLSQLAGRLESNGRVYLINPNGIVVGQGAVIDTAGFIASTLDMTDEDFIAGKLSFSGDGTEGAVINRGFIKTSEDGNVLLVAPSITNEGVIETDGGNVVLAAGQSVTITSLDDTHVQFDLQAPENEAINLGQIVTRGGAAAVFAGSIRNSGHINANALSVDEQGRIQLVAQDAVKLERGSEVTADGPGDGGNVTVTGASLTTEGRISASGGTGAGGSVSLEGTNWVGNGADINADGSSGGSVDITSGGGVSLATAISATGTNGDGGTVSVDAGSQIISTSTAAIDVSGASGGRITELAGQQITTSATYTARGTNDRGGQIDISAPATKLLSAAADASGHTGGGRIRVGGERGSEQKSPGFVDELPNAQTLVATSGTILTAETTGAHGDGGEVILWSDQNTMYFGDIRARPGSESGTGGFAEISSSGNYSFGGDASTGAGGEVLLDPKNIVVTDGEFSQLSLILGFNFSDIPSLSFSIVDGDEAGYNVDLDNQQMVIGAPGDDGFGDVTSNSGAALLLTFTDAAYSNPKLEGIIGDSYVGGKNINLNGILDADDRFGEYVSLDGTSLVVSAPYDDGSANGVADAGAVHLFTFSDTTFSGGSHVGTIGVNYAADVGSVVEAGDRIGPVSLSGTRLLIGTFLDDGASNTAMDAGAVHVIRFGSTALTGATLRGTIGVGYSGGSADVDVGSFVEAGDYFGGAVSISGDTAAIGAMLDAGDLNAFTAEGAVHLFSFSNSDLDGATREATIGSGYTTGKDLDVNAFLDTVDLFGASVSLSGTSLAVGTPWDDGAAGDNIDAGAVHLFTFTDTAFNGASHIGVIGDGYTFGQSIDVGAVLDAGDWFGGVDIDGTRLVSGANFDAGASNTGTSNGAVHLFSFSDTAFSNGVFDGTIGAGYDTQGAKNLDISEYLQSAPDGSATTFEDRFGSAVAVDGLRLVVGAPGDDSVDDLRNDTGAAYLFTFADTSFSGGVLEGIIGYGYTGGKNVDVTSILENSDLFGSAVSLDGNQLVVGTPGDDGSGNVLTDSGAVHLFTFADSSFSTGMLAGTIGSGYAGGGDLDVSLVLDGQDTFGSAVSLSSGALGLAVGSPSDDGIANGNDGAGAVLLFSFGGAGFSTPAHEATVGSGYAVGNDFNQTLGSLDAFGTAVSLDATRLAVGATGDDGAGDVDTDTGAVYLYNFTDPTSFTGGSLQTTIGEGYTVDLAAFLDTGLGDQQTDLFGAAVSLDGSRLAVGAPGDDFSGQDNNSANNSGAVYLFEFTDTTFTSGGLSAVVGVDYTDTNDVNTIGNPGSSGFNTRSGSSVALDGLRLVVGEPRNNGYNGDQFEVGAVNFYEFDSLSFTNGSLIGTVGDGFIGSGLDVQNLIDGIGYQEGDRFGGAVSLDGNRLAVGAPTDDGANVTIEQNTIGAVYLFDFADADFNGGLLQAVIGSGYTGGKNLDLSGVLDNNDYFGYSVSLDGNRLAVGSIFDDGFNNLASGTGAVRLFTFSDAAFSGGAHVATFGSGYVGAKDVDTSATLSTPVTAWFGSGVSLDGDRLAVGDAQVFTANSGIRGGAVYLFTFADSVFSTPTLQSEIGDGFFGPKAIDIGTSGLLGDQDYFGVGVSLNGNRLAVGAREDDGDGDAGNNIGATYLFSFSDAVFSGGTLESIIGSGYATRPKDLDISASLANFDNFGHDVSLDGGSPGCWRVVRSGATVQQQRVGPPV